MALKVKRKGRFEWRIEADGWQAQVIFWSVIALSYAAGRWL